MLDDPTALPEGTEVSIRALKSAAPRPRGKKQPLWFHDRYKKFIGIVKDLPPDISVNLDHYLYGAPKQE